MTLHLPHILHQRSKQLGLTLVELMIGLVIGMIIIGAVLYVFLGSRLTYQYNDTMGRIQENGRIAVDMMENDLRMTGFIGCRRLWAYLPSANTGSIAAQSITFSAAFEAAIENSIGITSGALDLATSGFVFNVALPDQVAGTDSVTILKGGTQIPLSEFMANEAGSMKTATTVPAGPAIISDCRFDTLSLSDNSPTGVPATAEGFMVTAAGTTIAHTEPFQRAYATDAGITPITATSYSIRATARTDSSGNPVLALFRDNDELIEGARSLCIRYGVATDPTNEAVGDYLAAAQVQALSNDPWKRVVAIRIELLLASVDDNTVDITQSEMPYCGDVFAPADRRMYKIFTATVGLRNQIVSY